MFAVFAVFATVAAASISLSAQSATSPAPKAAAGPAKAWSAPRTADGQPGTTAAPLFHNIAAWLLQRENVPLSPDPGPPLVLQG